MFRAYLFHLLLCSPVVSQLVTGYLPALILTIFLALMPLVMMTLSKQEGHVSIHKLDKVACSKMCK
jgi:hypothetical protein